MPSVTGLLIIAVFMTASGALLAEDDPNRTEANGKRPPRTPLAPSPSPSASPSVRTINRFYIQARTDRLYLSVMEVGTTDMSCTAHTFRVAGETPLDGVYLSDCAPWDRAGVPHVYLFFLRLFNRSEETMSIELKDFALVDRERKVHRPLRFPLFAENHLRDGFRLLPGSMIDGWVAFDGRPEFIPRSLTYSDEVEPITIPFEGSHVSEPL